MSVETDLRNEVFISKRKVDTLSGYVILQTDINLKSKYDSVDELLEKARKAIILD